MRKVYLVTRTRMAMDILYTETLRIYRKPDKALKYVASVTDTDIRVLERHFVNGCIDVPAEDGCTYSIEENILE